MVRGPATYSLARGCAVGPLTARITERIDRPARSTRADRESERDQPEKRQLDAGIEADRRIGGDSGWIAGQKNEMDRAPGTLSGTPEVIHPAPAWSGRAL